MTREEFSEGMDTLLANHAGAIVLDEYEKSLFLTLAQESVVKDFYNGSKPYELTEESRRALSQLTTTAVLTLTKVQESSPKLVENTFKITLPEDVLFIVYEQATIASEDVCLNNKTIPVVPTSADVFYRTNANPFRGPNKSRALRMDVTSGELEVISTYNLKEYTLRYVRKPYPIILTDLSYFGLSINGESSPKNSEKICELDESIHSLILLKAVELAVSLRTPAPKEAPKQNVNE